MSQSAENIETIKTDGFIESQKKKEASNLRKTCALFVSSFFRAVICLFWIFVFYKNFILELKKVNTINTLGQNIKIFFSLFGVKSFLSFIACASFIFFILNLFSRTYRDFKVVEGGYYSSKVLIPFLLSFTITISIIFLPALFVTISQSLFTNELNISIFLLLPLIYLVGSCIFNLGLHKKTLEIYEDIKSKENKYLLKSIAYIISIFIGFFTFIFNIHNILIKGFIFYINPNNLKELNQIELLHLINSINEYIETNNPTIVSLLQKNDLLKLIKSILPNYDNCIKNYSTLICKSLGNTLQEIDQEKYKDFINSFSKKLEDGSIVIFSIDKIISSPSFILALTNEIMDPESELIKKFFNNLLKIVLIQNASKFLFNISMIFEVFELPFDYIETKIKNCPTSNLNYSSYNKNGEQIIFAHSVN